MQTKTDIEVKVSARTVEDGRVRTCTMATLPVQLSEEEREALLAGDRVCVESGDKVWTLEAVRAHANAARLEKAFNLVAPKDWREEIDAFVTAEQLADVGVTAADIVEAIAHYTATETKVTDVSRPRGHVFSSVGYRRGPAGP